MNVLEELAIRLNWIAWALDFRPKPGLCPPECNENHTYLWPCRARIKRPPKSTVGAYHDVKTPHLDLDGIGSTMVLDPQCVERWPGCFSGGYEQKCCRFPKECHPYNFVEDV